LPAATRGGRLCATRFRLLRGLCIDLKPVTLLVGEPVGKTSLLEALAVIGYGVKHVYEAGREYTDPASVGSLPRFIRLTRCGALAAGAEAWLEADGKRIGARLACRGDGGAVIEYLEAEDGSGKERVHATISTSTSGGETRSRRLAAGAAEAYLAPRFYSYDLLAHENLAKGRTSRQEPRSYLAEDAANMGPLLAANPSLLVELNDTVAALTGAEVRVLSDSRVSVFAGYVEVGAAEASTTVLRLAYYYTALRAQGPPNATPVLGLDDPEAHMDVAAVEEIARLIAEASKRAYLLVATHSPLLVASLAREAGERLTVVHLSRGRGGAATPVAATIPVEEVTGLEEAARAMKRGPRA